MEEVESLWNCWKCEWRWDVKRSEGAVEKVQYGRCVHLVGAVLLMLE